LFTFGCGQAQRGRAKSFVPFCGHSLRPSQNPAASCEVGLIELKDGREEAQNTQKDLARSHRAFVEGTIELEHFQTLLPMHLVLCLLCLFVAIPSVRPRTPLHLVNFS